MSRLLPGFIALTFALGPLAAGAQDLSAAPVAANTAVVATVETPQAKPAQPARPATPAPPAPPAAPPLPLTPPAPPPTPVPPMPPAKLVNVQLEFTITDQTGTRAPDKKTVSMIAADGTFGRIRTSAVISRPGAPPLPILLNVDARPRLLAGDAVQTEITVEYRPFVAAPQASPDPETSQLNQSMTVILVSGRSMVLSQAADPVADRKIVLEAKATVLK
jgi:hypothetical protein